MISLVVAYDENRVIGLSGKMPWHFKEDLAYFKKVTEHHGILMGRKTYESILSYQNAPLKNRTHYVASRTLKDERVHVIEDVDAFLSAPREDELFVIGGAEIYALSLPYADRLYITHIEGTYPGDTFFPAWDDNTFSLLTKTTHGPLTFAVYERNAQ
jgi:dihydrofolate reductase